ncbi:hypothetical protein B4065_2700 [Caldibacillus thermoamylovorans]|nr:hypothetical protein B4065_2700 [Caldibacillus thermoamylovorans]
MRQGTCPFGGDHEKEFPGCLMQENLDEWRARAAQATWMI